jgi:hypothetical protein
MYNSLKVFATEMTGQNTGGSCRVTPQDELNMSANKY